MGDETNIGNIASRRLSADDRRAQLIELGREMFNSRRYSEISVDDIAQAASISIGLLYHYFGSKKEFFLAGLQQGAQELLDASAPDRDISPAMQVITGLKGYLDYVEAHSFGYLNLKSFQNEAIAMPELSDVNEQFRETIVDRYLQDMPPDMVVNATRVALKGYVGFTDTLVLDWLEHRSLDRQTLEKIIISCFCGAVRTALRIDFPDDSRIAEYEAVLDEVLAYYRI
jgi:AcrR family transcriptional regulator